MDVGNRGIKTGLWNEDLSVPGMLLPDSFEPDRLIAYVYPLLLHNA
jgi:hypothetical protein